MCAYDPGAVNLATFQNGEEPVLRIQRVRDIAAAQIGTQNAPVAPRCGKRVVGIDRLMGAVKGAKTQMQDARAMRRTVIGGNGDARRQIRRAGQARHAGPAWRSAASTPRNSARPFSRPMAG